MRFHVISLPHTQTTRAFSHCAYTEKVRKFCTMMTARKHEVFLYAGEENEADCTELITCITEKQRKKAVGKKNFYLSGTTDIKKPHWRKFLANAIEGVTERAQPRDFLCLSWGHTQMPIAEAVPHITAVEIGVGYDGYFAKHRVWESYAWMHRCYGKAGIENGVWYDAVIPNFFEVKDFPFSAKKDDYYLFMGRCNDDKGIHIAAAVCEMLKKRLVVAGHGTPPKNCEYAGVVDAKRRGKLLSRAKAVFVPTQYIEPFGGVAVEAMLCGTPVITTDFGAFTETVIQGGTGFRCRRLSEFLSAATAVESLDNQAIRDYAISRFSTEVVAPQYESYFQRLETLWGAGWNSLT